jgi:hypothetical protein
MYPNEPTRQAKLYYFAVLTVVFGAITAVINALR